MSQHVTAPQLSTGSKSTSRLAGSTWLWLKEAKSILKIAQSCVHLPFASCPQSVSFCFHPIHSTNPIQSSYWLKSPFSYIFTCFNQVNPGYDRVYLYVFPYVNSMYYFPICFICFNRVNPVYNRVYLYVFPWRSTGLFVDLSSNTLRSASSEAQCLGSSLLRHCAPWATARHFHQRPRNPCLGAIAGQCGQWWANNWTYSYTVTLRLRHFMSFNIMW